MPINAQRTWQRVHKRSKYFLAGADKIFVIDPTVAPTQAIPTKSPSLTSRVRPRIEANLRSTSDRNLKLRTTSVFSNTNYETALGGNKGRGTQITCSCDPRCGCSARQARRRRLQSPSKE